MACLIVHRHCSDPHCSDPHCSGPMSSLPQTRLPLLTVRDLLGLSGSRVNRVLTALIENRMVAKGRIEKVLAMDGRTMNGRTMNGRAMNGRAMNGRAMNGRAMDGRRGRPLLSRDPGVGRSVQPDNSRGPTGQPIESTRTGRTPLTWYALDEVLSGSGAERSTNPAGNPRGSCDGGRWEKEKSRKPLQNSDLRQEAPAGFEPAMAALSQALNQSSSERRLTASWM
jgi:hypothetical protein